MIDNTSENYRYQSARTEMKIKFDYFQPTKPNWIILTVAYLISFFEFAGA